MKNKIEVNTIKPELSFYINEQSYRVLDLELETILDGDINSIEDYMNTTDGFNKTALQKDEDYAQAQNLWKKYQTDLKDTKFNLYLNRIQYNLLTDILIKKLEYDVNNIFIAIELTELLGVMNSFKFTNDIELKGFRVTPTEITYIYHLIQNFKVKGLTRDAYTFSKILIRIGEVSKVINYYDTYAKNLTGDISKWALSLDATSESENLIDELDPNSAL
jgi:hypothetical protein